VVDTLLCATVLLSVFLREETVIIWDMQLYKARYYFCDFYL